MPDSLWPWWWAAEQAPAEFTAVPIQRPSEPVSPAEMPAWRTMPGVWAVLESRSLGRMTLTMRDYGPATGGMHEPEVVRCQVSGVRCQVSGVRWRVSGAGEPGLLGDFGWAHMEAVSVGA